jgi:MFS family permease
MVSRLAGIGKRMLRTLGPFLTTLLATGMVGVVVPSVLIDLGFSPLLIVAFTLALFALLLDGTITKIGFNRAVNELNPIVAFLTRRIGANASIVVTRVAGCAVLLYGLLGLKNAYMLLAVAWIFFMLVFAGTLSILFSDVFRLATNPKITQDS